MRVNKMCIQSNLDCISTATLEWAIQIVIMSSKPLYVTILRLMEGTTDLSIQTCNHAIIIVRQYVDTVVDYVFYSRSHSTKCSELYHTILNDM